MKPPPPMLPALGCVTASANAVATAASTAFPPRASTAAPASQAGADVQTTSPPRDATPAFFRGPASGAEAARQHSAATIACRTAVGRTRCVVIIDTVSTCEDYTGIVPERRASCTRRRVTTTQPSFGAATLETDHTERRGDASREQRGPQIWPGSPYPLGATYDGVGTN